MYRMSKSKWAGTISCPSPTGMGTHIGVFSSVIRWTIQYGHYRFNISWVCKALEGKRNLRINSKYRTNEEFFSWFLFFFFQLGSDISLKQKLSLGTHQLEQNSSLSLLTKLQTPVVYKSWNCIGNTCRHVAWIQSTIYTPQEAGVYRGRHLLPPKAIGDFPSFLMEATSIPYYGNAKGQIAWAQGSCSSVWPLLYICWILTLSSIFLVQ